MLWCTIRISNHDLTHHHHNSSQYNHATISNVATPRTISLSSHILPPPSYHIPTPSPRLSKSPRFCLTNSIHLPDTVPKNHPINQLQLGPWQYPLPRFEVFQENFPTVLASRGIVDETPLLSVTRPRTSQAPMPMNHTQSNVPGTVTDFDTSDYLQYSKPDNPLHCQLSPEVADQLIV